MRIRILGSYLTRLLLTAMGLRGASIFVVNPVTSEPCYRRIGNFSY
ncbi:MAG: hypothetical protein HON48_05040 [Desulfobacula sp.]|nr:hypothetical protein [Desulfobacula sp.]